ncbi:hypothetical protein MMOR_01910 [Mycolicibacterium moriokaense]|uniref:Uncharacterized protein n=1 Tax=Mycolicibacterium moriokaense TaxID=39691 RepID=A0AAD1H6Q4_9MYCO|nr:hypothetical protein MMOR_01910 [Mycolicibacterium moriokaense]
MAGLKGHVGHDDADRRAGAHPLDGGQEATRSADSALGTGRRGAGFRHAISVPGGGKAAEYGYSGGHGWKGSE